MTTREGVTGVGMKPRFVIIDGVKRPKPRVLDDSLSFVIPWGLGPGDSRPAPQFHDPHTTHPIDKP